MLKLCIFLVLLISLHAQYACGGLSSEGIEAKKKSQPESGSKNRSGSPRRSSSEEGSVAKKKSQPESGSTKKKIQPESGSKNRSASPRKSRSASPRQSRSESGSKSRSASPRQNRSGSPRQNRSGSPRRSSSEDESEAFLREAVNGLSSDEGWSSDEASLETLIVKIDFVAKVLPRLPNLLGKKLKTLTDGQSTLLSIYEETAKSLQALMVAHKQGNANDLKEAKKKLESQYANAFATKANGELAAQTDKVGPVDLLFGDLFENPFVVNLTDILGGELPDKLDDEQIGAVSRLIAYISGETYKMMDAAGFHAERK